MALSDKDPELLVQLPVFANGIAADVGRFQLSNADAQAMLSAVNRYVQRCAVWRDPATRTSTACTAKDAARISALGICRVFYRLIQLNQGISNASKLAIGVTPLSGTRTPRLCPQVSPALFFNAATPGAHTLNFRDSTGLVPRGLPFGATMCQVFVEVGPDNAETFDESRARFIGNFVRNPIVVTYDSADRGKQATYFARWGGKRNQFGQWSLPLAVTIAA